MPPINVMMTRAQFEDGEQFDRHFRNAYRRATGSRRTVYAGQPQVVGTNLYRVTMTGPYLPKAGASPVLGTALITVSA